VHNSVLHLTRMTLVNSGRSALHRKPAISLYGRMLLNQGGSVPSNRHRCSRLVSISTKFWAVMGKVEEKCDDESRSREAFREFRQLKSTNDTTLATREDAKGVGSRPLSSLGAKGTCEECPSARQFR